MVSEAPLDVVAELTAHQQNLVPWPPRARAALVALPLAPVCALLDTCFARRRARELAGLAEALGGGDGPLPVVELGDIDLDGQLARLWGGGVRAVFAHGMVDQPGFARALAYRWPGELVSVGGSALALLHDGDPVVWLADGVARVAPWGPVPDGARRALVGLDEEGDPRRIDARGAEVAAFAIDPGRRLGAWSGVVPPRGALGTDEGARLRGVWQAWWAERGQPDLVRLAVLGLEPALEAALRPAAPRAQSAARRARILVVTGVNGSGKSTQVERLARHLGDRGAAVRVIKLYRQGAFLELADQLGARTRRGAPLACFRVSRIVKLIDSLRVHRDHVVPALDACDALLMDRYVETHVAAARSQLDWDLAAHPALAPWPVADVRFWLEIDPEVALGRRDARGGSATADEHATGMRGYAREFARLARGDGEVRLDATAPAGENAAAIAAHADRLVTSPRGPADASRLVPPPAAPTAASVSDAVPRRCELRLGGTGGLELGAEVFALRAALGDGAGAGGAPESFWLEAYAAQLLIDLRVHARARARAALWPGALARMPGHADLPVLDELAR